MPSLLVTAHFIGWEITSQRGGCISLALLCYCERRWVSQVATIAEVCAHCLWCAHVHAPSCRDCVQCHPRGGRSDHSLCWVHQSHPTCAGHATSASNWLSQRAPRCDGVNHVWSNAGQPPRSLGGPMYATPGVNGSSSTVGRFCVFCRWVSTASSRSLGGLPRHEAPGVPSTTCSGPLSLSASEPPPLRNNST